MKALKITRPHDGVPVLAGQGGWLIVLLCLIISGSGPFLDVVEARDNQALPQVPGTTEIKTLTKSVDPCTIATQNQLKTLLAAGMAGYFPLKDSKDGEHVTISDPSLTDLVCPNLRITIFAHIRYQKTRGIPQFSTSGEVRFTSPLIVRVTFAPSNPPALQKASACLTHIDLIGLNLNKVPNWLDGTWVKNWLNARLANQMCFDMTGLVNLYLQQGGKL